MYSDVKQKKRSWLLWAALIALAVLALLLFLGRDPGRDLSMESAEAIRSAVERGALQCYAVEGIYPPDLDYLRDNYGLQINTRDFYVTYDAFASNLPPTVTVLAKGR